MVTEDVMDKGGTRHRGDDFAVVARQLPDLFDSVTEFIAVVLATHDHYDNISYSINQTYKAGKHLIYSDYTFYNLDYFE
jgi:hypothetical protein